MSDASTCRPGEGGNSAQGASMRDENEIPRKLGTTRGGRCGDCASVAQRVAGATSRRGSGGGKCGSARSPSLTKRRSASSRTRWPPGGDSRPRWRDSKPLQRKYHRSATGRAGQPVSHVLSLGRPLQSTTGRRENILPAGRGLGRTIGSGQRARGAGRWRASSDRFFSDATGSRISSAGAA